MPQSAEQLQKNSTVKQLAENRFVAHIPYAPGDSLSKAEPRSVAFVGRIDSSIREQMATLSKTVIPAIPEDSTVIHLFQVKDAAFYSDYREIVAQLKVESPQFNQRYEARPYCFPDDVRQVLARSFLLIDPCGGWGTPPLSIEAALSKVVVVQRGKPSALARYNYDTGEDLMMILKNWQTNGP